MLARILIGVDGSTEGNSALELGIRWPNARGASLVGVGVVDEAGLHGPEEWVAGETYFRGLNNELRAEMGEKLRRALERSARRSAEEGVEFEAVQQSGTPSSELVQVAQRCDLVMLGQHTHFRLGWADEADDTLDRVLSDSSRPIVAVPEIPTEGDSVVIAYDGSLQAARTLAAFEALGLGRDRDIHIISADSDWQSAARCADRAVEFLAAHDIKARSHPMPSASPAETILDWVYRLHAGLVVMGAYGKPALRDFFLGSVTRTLLRESPVPVFLYH